MTQTTKNWGSWSNKKLKPNADKDTKTVSVTTNRSVRKKLEIPDGYEEQVMREEQYDSKCDYYADVLAYMREICKSKGSDMFSDTSLEEFMEFMNA